MTTDSKTVSRYQVKSMSRCAVCDAWYDDTDPDQYHAHRHPEPQSGPERDAWIAYGVPYDEWIRNTPEGNKWYFDDPERRYA
jgi:hypothetical protein